MSNKELIQMKEDFLLNLDKEDLKVYIDNTIREYYNNYIANDNENLKTNVIELMRLTTLFEDKYPNMSNYLNYRLVVLSNKVFESIFDGRSEMYYPLEHTSLEMPENEIVVNMLEKVKQKRMELNKIRQKTFRLNNVNYFINFVENLPDVEGDAKLPKELIDKLCAFMEGVKSGEYDGYLEISEDDINDDEGC